MTNPLYLNKPGETHVLADDLRCPGTAVYLAAPNVTLDLNGHTVYYGGDGGEGRHGVRLHLSWEGGPDIPDAQAPVGCKVMNGRIVHEASGKNCHGVFGTRGGGLILDGVEILSAGPDSHCVWVRYAGVNGIGLVIRNCILRCNARETENRHAAPANVQMGAGVSAEGNVLIGGNSGFNAGSYSLISRNVILHDSFATNGYGVFLYKMESCSIADNLILPANGRGVLLHGGKGHRVEGNAILAMERPNAEYGTSLNPPCVRVRQYPVGMGVRWNECLAVGGSGLTAASGLYLSNSGKGVNEIEDNVFSAVLRGSPAVDRYAQAITLEGSGMYADPCQDVISHNACFSNHLQIRTEGYDGWGYLTEPMRRNGFFWSAGSSEVEWFSVVALRTLARLHLHPQVAEVALQQVTKQLDKLTESMEDVGISGGRAFWFPKVSSFSKPDHHGEVTLLDSLFGSGVDPTTLAPVTNTSGSVTYKIGRHIGGGKIEIDTTISKKTPADAKFEIT